MQLRRVAVRRNYHRYEVQQGHGWYNVRMAHRIMLTFVCDLLSDIVPHQGLGVDDLFGTARDQHDSVSSPWISLPGS